MNTRYLATINVPGYLPMDDEPPVFDTATEAWSYLAEERRRGEDDTAEGDEPYSDTVEELERRAAEGTDGTVIGDTPGGRMYDLGIAYSVTEVTDED